MSSLKREVVTKYAVVVSAAITNATITPMSDRDMVPPAPALTNPIIPTGSRECQCGPPLFPADATNASIASHAPEIG